jgi:DNA-binding response OmpR family regulator
MILVVDDNEMNRDMLARRLKRQGYTVEMAEDGQMALDMLAEKDYGLVLLDIMMPRLNGYEVLEQIKADSRLRRLPVIMISAVDDLDSVVKCIELGAEDYLFKPFNPVLLKARVDASMRRNAGTGDAALHEVAAGLQQAAAALEGHVDDPALLEALHAEIEKLQYLAG